MALPRSMLLPPSAIEDFEFNKTNFDCAHGPSASAERFQGKRKKVPKGMPDKDWWRTRVERLEKLQVPAVVSSIFAGVNCYFEGYTDQTSALHLKKLVQSNGGNVSHFSNKTRVTHIICTSLCHGKANRMLSESSRTTIKAVHPQWIHDCIAKGKKLATEEYEIGQEKNKLSIRAFMDKNSATENQEPTPVAPHILVPQRVSSCVLDQPKTETISVGATERKKRPKMDDIVRVLNRTQPSASISGTSAPKAHTRFDLSKHL